MVEYASSVAWLLLQEVISNDFQPPSSTSRVDKIPERRPQEDGMRGRRGTADVTVT